MLLTSAISSIVPSPFTISSFNSSNKEEFEVVSKRFVIPEKTERPILLELHTNTKDENKAHELITTISMKSKAIKKGTEILSNPVMKDVKSVVKKIMKG